MIADQPVTTPVNPLQRAVLETSYAVLAHKRQQEVAQQQERIRLAQENQLQHSALELLHTTLESSPDGIAVVNFDDQILIHNHQFVSLWQLPEEIIGQKNDALVRAFCANQMMAPEQMDLPIREEMPPRSTLVTDIARKDGRTYQRRVAAHMQGDQFGGWMISWHDITLSRQSAQERDRLARVVETSLNEIYIFDAQTLLFTYVNACARENLGYTQTQLNQITAVDIKPQFDETGFRDMVRPLLAGELELLNFETVHQRADGTRYYVQVHLQIDRNDTPPAFVALILDISDRKRSERVIWDQAHFDHLTGLPNRILLTDRLSENIKKAHRTKGHVAVMFIDLDKFKDVNDTLGHDQGDRLLIVVAERLKQAVRSSDTVARMGGDEFVVLVSDLDDARSVVNLAHNIVERVVEPIDLNGHMVSVTASVGIAAYPDDGTTVESLLRCADQAMYLSKSRGRNCYAFYTPDLEAGAQRRMRLISTMRSALATNQFFLNFQPIVDLRTGVIEKAEALLRWQHPELGLISPFEFIPLAEESGVIVAIGEWVFDQALTRLQHWRALTGKDIQISINKSPLQFHAQRLHNMGWIERMQSQGLPGHSLIIEITEGLLVDATDQVQNSLLRYRDAGIQVAIDDFGTGYSALAYLNRFDIDFLKIDRSFVQNIETHKNDQTLIEAIITMAHALGLKVVAEGVETEQQLALLKAAQCDYGQGYFFSRPVTPEAFELMITAA